MIGTADIYALKRINSESVGEPESTIQLEFHHSIGHVIYANG